MMERNTQTSTGLEWENLALYGGKPIEIPEQLGFSMCTSASNNLYFNDIGSSSSSTKDANLGYVVGSLPPNITGSTVACSGEPTIGLRLGEQRENRDSFGYNSNKASLPSLPVAPASSTRVTRVSMQNPCCQVEGCHIDLSAAKDYHRRHRICESHSKSPKVVVAGMERRFCQQCSRFHDLAEFDDKKRSCRRRLSVHNARRRRLQPESVHLSSGLTSALYDRRPPNLLLNGLPVSLSNSTWENASSSILRQARDTFTRPTNAAGPGRNSPNFPSISNPISSLQNSSPQVLDHCLNVPTTTISPTAPDLHSAPSLLSPTSWSMHEAESRSMEGLLAPATYNSVSRERFQLDNSRAEQPENSLNVHHEAGPSHMQEFQLFKASYESDCFYSNHRNL